MFGIGRGLGYRENEEACIITQLFEIDFWFFDTHIGERLQEESAVTEYQLSYHHFPRIFNDLYPVAQSITIDCLTQVLSHDW